MLNYDVKDFVNLVKEFIEYTGFKSIGKNTDDKIELIDGIYIFTRYNGDFKRIYSIIDMGNSYELSFDWLYLDLLKPPCTEIFICNNEYFSIYIEDSDCYGTFEVNDSTMSHIFTEYDYDTDIKKEFKRYAKRHIKINKIKKQLI